MKVKKLEPRVEVEEWKCPGIKPPMARHQVASGKSKGKSDQVSARKCKGNSGRTVSRLQQKHEEEHPHSEVGVAGKTWRVQGVPASPQVRDAVAQEAHRPISPEENPQRHVNVERTDTRMSKASQPPIGLSSKSPICSLGCLNIMNMPR